jgi:murein DD-endopeptidase MepM/ murein hydrolase activator NlpD
VIAGPRRALPGVVALTVLLAHAATPAATTAKAPVPQPARVHEVGPGDTLTRIARRYRVTVPALVTANRLASDRVIIRVGQRLVIPGPTPGAPAAPPAVPTWPRRSLRPRPPANIVLAVPDFTDRLPLFAWPADGHVTSVFGRRRRGWHNGVDIKGQARAPIIASAGGVVVASGLEPRYGRVVKIEHINGFLTVYAHNERNLVTVGHRVATGQPIALVGRTGQATAHHVHFEIRQSGRAYNPLYFLPLPPRIAVLDGGHDDDDEPDE